MTSDEKDAFRRDQSNIIHALKQTGAKFKTAKDCTCPFHEDSHPSAGIYQDERGIWRFKCQASACGFGGDVFDVMARAQGRTVDDVLREMSEQSRPRTEMQTKPQPQRGKQVFPTIDAIRAITSTQEVYVYSNPTTRVPEMIVVRLSKGGSKTFLQGRPVDGGFVLEAPPKPWPLYNRSRVAAAKSVIVVEGEKCVHALAEIGIVATTSPGGAGKAAHADWSPLAGKMVYLWPDADTPDPKTQKTTGEEHMRDVAKMLETLEPAPTVMWLDVAQLELPPKGDVVEYIRDFGGDTTESQRNAIMCALQLAQPVGASREVHQLVEDTIAGKRRAIPWPWRSLGQLTKALMPGTLTAICGDPGSTKSFLLLEAAMYWHNNGVKIAIYELEEDRAYHLNRALAQLGECADLTDSDWIYQHPAEAREAIRRHRTFLDGFGRCIHAAPDEQVSLDDLIAWVQRQAEAGRRIIAIDPITAAKASDTPWIDDLRFIMSAKTIVRQYGCSLVLVTHPRKGKKSGTGLDDLAGGAAYSRFSQTVFWIHRHDKPTGALIADAMGDYTTVINRSIRISKTRNGRGAGLEIGCTFDGATLKLTEHGIVKREVPAGEVKTDIASAYRRAARPHPPKVTTISDPFATETTPTSGNPQAGA